jgi:hypothetical protein
MSHASGRQTNFSTGCQCGNWTCMTAVFMATQVDFLTDNSIGCQCGIWTCMTAVFMATQVDF